MPRHIHSFLRRSASERFLPIKALFVITGINGGLSLLPLPHVHALFEQARAAMGVRHDIMAVPSKAQLVWAVRAASRYVPSVSCLTQALAALLLLERYGYPAHVWIGVGWGGLMRCKGGFRRAWLESEGAIVVGQAEIDFVPLITLGAATRSWEVS